jgi:hypothetical protein
MVRLSRYFLVAIAVIAFSIVMPKLYWMAFAQPNRVPFVMYSCIENDFMIQRSNNGVVREDRKGNTYTREEYEQKLPLLYTQQLAVSGTMPDSIDGIAMDMHEITWARSTFRARPKDISKPDPGLYPLFEAESGRANLEMPKDFFRITWRMEFLDAETNKILEEKSQMFSAVLYKSGFKFPAKSINGLPTTRKSCDEGYLIVDSEEQLFHVKLIKGKPYVKKVDVPDGLTFKFISCVDFRDKKYYAYLFSNDNHVYILTQDDYELVKFPIEGIDPSKYETKIYGDLFNYNVIYSGEDFVTSYVLDSEYKVVDKFNETWLSRDQRLEGKIFSFLFPGQISMANADSEFIKFFFDLTKSINWLLLSFILIMVQYLIIRRRKDKISNHFVDFCVVAVTGIFGFLAINIFQNKFFD